MYQPRSRDQAQAIRGECEACSGLLQPVSHHSRPLTQPPYLILRSLLDEELSAEVVSRKYATGEPIFPTTDRERSRCSIDSS